MLYQAPRQIDVVWFDSGLTRNCAQNVKNAGSWENRKKTHSAAKTYGVGHSRNERRFIDFGSDQLFTERRVHVFTIIDDFTLKCMGRSFDRSISGIRLFLFMDTLGHLPEKIVLYNGPK